MPTLRIPFYDGLAPRQKQWVHMGLVAGALLGVVLLVSAMIGEPPSAGPGGPAPASTPQARSLTTVPGQHLDDKAAWIGGAGKEIATLRQTLTEHKREQDNVNAELARQLKTLAEAKASPAPAPSAAAPQPPPPQPSAASAADAGTATHPPFAGAPRAGRAAPPPPLASASGFPPGAPNGPGGAPDSKPVPSAGLVRVRLHEGAEDKAGSPSASGAASAKPDAKAGKRVESFLPVSFTRAVLLGGIDAPTGGVAQSNPIPVLLKLLDFAVLPNQYRSNVKECFVVAEAYGDVSSERAYPRLLTLSCVLKGGQAIEVKLKGSVFGEDGKNGLRGRLVTKQGQILANALLAGVASGIGQGFSTSASTIAISPLGTTSTTGNSTGDILKSGLGQGVGKAMDRLAQYYISLAEKTFPVIEVDAGRIVDVVVTEGVALDGALGVSGQASERPAASRRIDRSALLQAVNEDNESE